VYQVHTVHDGSNRSMWYMSQMWTASRCCRGMLLTHNGIDIIIDVPLS